MDSGRCTTKKMCNEFMRNEYHQLSIEHKSPFEAQQLALKNDHDRWVRSEHHATSVILQARPLPQMTFSVLSFSNNAQATLQLLSLDTISRLIQQGGNPQQGIRPEYMISQQVSLLQG